MQFSFTKQFKSLKSTLRRHLLLWISESQELTFINEKESICKHIFLLSIKT